MADPFAEMVTTAERSQIMGHARAGIFDRFYLNQIVGTDTQSAYLGTPSKDALISLAGHMSLTRDPQAQDSVKIDPAVVALDPEVQQLEQQQVQLRADLVMQFGGIEKGKGTETYTEYRTVCADLKRAKQRVSRSAFDETWKEYFQNASTEYIDAQRHGTALPFVENHPAFEFEERTRLAELLCQNQNVNELSEQEIYHNRLEALQNMISLCSCRETHRPVEDIFKEESKAKDPNDFPISCPATQCLFCLGDQSLSIASCILSFSCTDALKRHVDRIHLKTHD